jgi:predicted thioredoxin/glutaredoxin
MRVELVTREGCHLCDEAEKQLLGVGLEVHARNVDADAELFRLYDFRVPVVLFEGRVIGEGKLDAAAIRAALVGHFHQDQD